MKTVMRSLLAIVFMGVFAQVRAADRTVGEGGEEQRPLATNDPESDEPKIGPIIEISRLMDLRVKPADGDRTWKTVDALLDVEVGRLVMLCVEPEGAGGDRGACWIAWRRVAEALTPQRISDAAGGAIPIEVTAAELEKSPHVDSAQSLSREWASSVISSIRSVGPSGVTGRKYDPDLELTRWSKLRNRAVVNREKQALGSIVDLAIAVPGGHIGYAAMSSPDLPVEQLRPMPLSAFVTPPGEHHWLLELPEDIVKNTATFARGAWPRALDQGWVEYVHVRYGRSPFEGVRLEPHGEKTGDR